MALQAHPPKGDGPDRKTANEHRRLPLLSRLRPGSHEVPPGCVRRDVDRASTWSSRPGGHLRCAHRQVRRQLASQHRKRTFVSMRSVVAAEYVSIDGVMQDPGGVGEIEHGGWSNRY